MHVVERWRAAHPSPSLKTVKLPLWVMEGERASDRGIKGGRGRGEKERVTQTEKARQTEKQTDVHAHTHVFCLDKLARVLVNIRLKVWLG